MANKLASELPSNSNASMPSALSKPSNKGLAFKSISKSFELAELLVKSTSEEPASTASGVVAVAVFLG